MHIAEVTFSSNFCFVETVSRFEQRLEIQELSLDIQTGIETFDSWVLILSLESRLLKFESWYRDWNWDYQILSLDIETGIKTFEITVLISRLVLRLKKQRGIPVVETLARVTAHLWKNYFLFCLTNKNGKILGFYKILLKHIILN